MTERPLVCYEAAVMDNARKPGEGAIAYITRLAEIVEGQPLPKIKDVPSGRLPYRDSEDTNWTGQP